MAMQSQNLGGDALTAIMGGVGDIFNFTGAINEYKNSQEQGDNGAVSIAKAVGSFAWSEFYVGGASRIIGNSFIGKGFTMAGSIAGGATAGLGGAITGGIAGSIARLAGKQGAAIGGLVGGAQAGASIGSTIGGMVGGMIPVMAFTMGSQLAAQLPKYWENNANVMTKAYRQRGKLGSGYFEMSQAGYTMRQRSLNAIRQNGINTQTALGNEARMYFRGSGLDD